MKCVFVLVTIALTAAAWGESPFEQQLTKLKVAHYQEVSKATGPIEKKFKEDLEELLQQAMKGGDLDAAIKIREAIRSLASPGVSDAKLPKSPGELRDFLHGTTWNISDQSPDSKVLYTLTFSRDGTFRHSDGRTGKYETTSGRSFVMWGYDPAVLNADCSEFAAVSRATAYFGARKK